VRIIGGPEAMVRRNGGLDNAKAAYVRLTIVGAGMMGAALSRVAVARLDVGRLVVVDIDGESAHRVANDVAGPDLRPEARLDWRSCLQDTDIMLLAVPWPVAVEVLAATAHLPIGVVGIARPSADVERPLPDGVRQGPVILPIGLEPGLTEIVLEHVAGSFDRVTTARILCGGLTTPPPDGFPYRRLFGATSLPFADRPAYRLVDGVRERAQRFSGLAPASLPGLPNLESYHDGMVPWLVDNPHLRGATVEQRTVRWPGFASAVRTLRDAGLLDDDPVAVPGGLVSPRHVTTEVLGRRIRRADHEREITHLEVDVTGLVDGAIVRRTVNLSCADADTPLSSGLATLTAVPAVEAVAHAAGCPPGWVRPDHLFRDERLAALGDALKQYGVVWRDTHDGSMGNR
jgi:lysine 6-dehydrogenase